MSVSAVKNEIRIARTDSVISEAEAKKIVAAAKRNITPKEVAQIQALINATATSEVVANEDARATLYDATTRPPTESVGKIVKDTVIAPASLAILGSTLLVIAAAPKSNFLLILSVGAAALLIFLASLLSILLAPVTAVVGLVRAAVIKLPD